jgi:uncharacterized membrane protein YeaQ/YmgE (transglycosylase-associated protein family)
MTIGTLILWIIVGGIAGWLAKTVVGRTRIGLVSTTIVGIIGALIGGWLFTRLGIAIGGGILGSIVTAFVGAVILLLILRALKGTGR